MTTAIAMRDKLVARRQTEFAAVQALELERRRVTLAAYAGDEEAKARLDVIRVQLNDYSQSLQDIAQVVDDLEPKVRREFRQQARAGRRDTAAKIDASMNVAFAAAERIDGALDALMAAMAEATPALDKASGALCDLTLPVSHGDPGAHAMNRMLALQTSSLRGVPDMLFLRLSALGLLPQSVAPWPLPKCASMVDMLANARSVAFGRVGDVFARDAAEERADAEEDAPPDQAAEAA